MEPTQSGGNAAADPWSGWGAFTHPDAPDGAGGFGRFKTAGPLGTSTGHWHGVPHPLAPAARYLSVADAYCDRGAFPSVRVEEFQGVYFVSMVPRAAMRPFMRTANERFESTVKRVAARSKLAVVINGNMYSDSKWNSIPRHIAGNLGVPIPSQAAGYTTPEGKVRGRGEELGGNSQPLMYYLAWTEGPTGGYTFGMGNPPGDTTAAIGGLGPVIYGGRRFGAKNKYRPGVPPGAPETGKPDSKYEGYLEIRSNLTYASFADGGIRVGKVIVGFGSGELPLKIVVQPDGVDGITLDDIRDRLFHEGVRDAVFLDGSDSAMLFANGRFLVQQGTFKDRTNTVGIGFQVPCAYLDPPGRAVGNIA